MALNIKSREAHELASGLAQLTGQSMTSVVLDALRKQWEEIQRQQQKKKLSEELMAIGKRCAAHIHQPAVAIALSGK